LVSAYLTGLHEEAVMTLINVIGILWAILVIKVAFRKSPYVMREYTFDERLSDVLHYCVILPMIFAFLFGAIALLILA
jgi:hypothetical protein